MGKIDITKGIPHKYPFVLVDRIEEIEYMRRSKGVKYISANEPWVTGHFPEEPIYPGVYIIETMAQVGGFIFYNPEVEGKLGKMYLCGVNNLKISHSVTPGDVLVVEAEISESFAHLFQIQCTATVMDQVVASGIITLASVK